MLVTESNLSAVTHPQCFPSELIPTAQPQVDSTTAVLVSIIMPVFNAAPFLNKSVSSVESQTYSNWELILVDDGSTDDSRRLCCELAQRDLRIKALSQSNRGPAAARNRGVRAACGEFLCFLDADDALLPIALETLLAAASASGADVALGNFCKQEGDRPPIPQPAIFSPDGEPFSGKFRILTEADLIEYLRHFLHHPSNHLVSYCWARLYRLSLVRDHALEADETMRLFEDFAFNLDYLAKARRLVFVNKPVYIYTLRPGHASASMEIFAAPQLVADMEMFRRKVDAFLDALAVGDALAATVRREVGHTLVHYAIIFLVRTCRQLNAENRALILNEIRKLVESTTLTSCLSFYRPRPGNSRILPILMRLKLVRLLAVIGKLKGNRRYGRVRISHNEAGIVGPAKEKQ